MATTTVNQKAVQAIENRKLRNRLSQKAYRARQCMRIKELEERLDGHPESAKIKELENQNQQLRDQLLSCHKKLESLSLSMKALADAAATSIGLETGNGTSKVPPSHHDPDTPPNEENITVADFGVDFDDGKDDMVQQDIARVPEMGVSPIGAEDIYISLENSSTSALATAQSVNLPRAQELAYWSGTSTPKAYNFDGLLRDGASPFFGGGNSNFAYQSMSPFSQLQLPSYAGMGGSSYANTAGKAPLLIRGPHGELHKSNSLFSDHIAVVEHFLKQRWASPKSLLKHGEEGLANSVSFMLSVFVCISWRFMTSWHTYTRAHVPLKRLHIWRLNPTAEAYMKMDSWYRPTQIQLSIPHPSIIDWMPWPSMRDKLILYHAANPRLDEVICDIGNNYVMECDSSKLVDNMQPTRVIIGVVDLVHSIAPTATSDPNQDDLRTRSFDPDFSAEGSSPGSSIEDTDGAPDINCSLPAPNVDALFASKAFALQAFKALGCDKGANRFRLDPEFFRMHPELYEPAENLMGNGVIRLRPPNSKSISPPRALDSAALGQYRELSTWTFDLSFFQSDASHAA